MKHATYNIENEGKEPITVTIKGRLLWALECLERGLVTPFNWQWIIQRLSGTRRGGIYWKSVSYHRDRHSLTRRWRDFVGAEARTEELGRLPKSFGRNI